MAAAFDGEGEGEATVGATLADDVVPLHDSLGGLGLMEARAYYTGLTGCSSLEDDFVASQTGGGGGGGVGGGVVVASAKPPRWASSRLPRLQRVPYVPPARRTNEPRKTNSARPAATKPTSPPRPPRSATPRAGGASSVSPPRRRVSDGSTYSVKYFGEAQGGQLGVLSRTRRMASAIPNKALTDGSAIPSSTSATVVSQPLAGGDQEEPVDMEKREAELMQSLIDHSSERTWVAHGFLFSQPLRSNARLRSSEAATPKTSGIPAYRGTSAPPTRARARSHAKQRPAIKPPPRGTVAKSKFRESGPYIFGSIAGWKIAPNFQCARTYGPALDGRNPSGKTLHATVTGETSVGFL